MRERIPWGDEREPGPNYGAGLVLAARPASGHLGGQMVGFGAALRYLGGHMGDSRPWNIGD